MVAEATTYGAGYGNASRWGAGAGPEGFGAGTFSGGYGHGHFATGNGGKTRDYPLLTGDPPWEVIDG